MNNRISAHEIEDVLLTQIDNHLKQALESTVKSKRSKAELLQCLDSFEKSEIDKRKAMPRIYDKGQKAIVTAHPEFPVRSPSWFADQIKHMKNFNALDVYKQHARKLINEKREGYQPFEEDELLLRGKGTNA